MSAEIDPCMNLMIDPFNTFNREDLMFFLESRLALPISPDIQLRLVNDLEKISTFPQGSQVFFAFNEKSNSFIPDYVGKHTFADQVGDVPEQLLLKLIKDKRYQLPL